jgi:hypothetical protein
MGAEMYIYSLMPMIVLNPGSSVTVQFYMVQTGNI